MRAGILAAVVQTLIGHDSAAMHELKVPLIAARHYGKLSLYI
jgi:hypothetical protein